MTVIEVTEREPLVIQRENREQFCSAPDCKSSCEVELIWTPFSSCCFCGGTISLCDEHYAQLRSELLGIIAPTLTDDMDTAQIYAALMGDVT